MMPENYSLNFAKNHNFYFTYLFFFLQTGQFWALSDHHAPMPQ